MKHLLRYVRPLLVLAIFAGAVWLLYHRLGEFFRPDFGVRTEPQTKEGGPKNALGVIVREVTPESPADKAGVRKGDVIAWLDDQPIVAPKDLQHAMRGVKTGTPVALTVLRGREKVELTVVPAADYQKVAQGIRKIRLSHVLLAIALTGLNYVFLFGYDYLAIKHVGHPLALRKMILASFIGHVSSFNFGAILGGSSMRYRFYSKWNFSPIEIVQLIAILGITFWIGVIALAGIVFVVAPFDIPKNIAHLVPMDNVRPLGTILLALVAVYILLCAWRREPIKLWHWELPLPPPRLIVGQLAVSFADLIVAASVFYVLLPAEAHAQIAFVHFLGVFLLGMVAAVFTHIPAGVGIFELMIIEFLPAQLVIVPMLVFRAVYYLLPLAVAGIVLLGHEILAGHEYLRKVAVKRGWFSGNSSGNGQETSSQVRPASADRQEGAGRGEEREAPADDRP